MEKEIIIENDLSEIIRITRLLESIGVTLFLPSTTTRQICLAVEEAVSCIIHHAYPNGEKSKIKLRISQVNGDINCMIINNGLFLCSVFIYFRYIRRLPFPITFNPFIGRFAVVILTN